MTLSGSSGLRRGVQNSLEKSFRRCAAEQHSAGQRANGLSSAREHSMCHLPSRPHAACERGVSDVQCATSTHNRTTTRTVRSASRRESQRPPSPEHPSSAQAPPRACYVAPAVRTQAQRAHVRHCVGILGGMAAGERARPRTQGSSLSRAGSARWSKAAATAPAAADRDAVDAATARASAVRSYFAFHSCQRNLYSQPYT